MSRGVSKVRDCEEWALGCEGEAKRRVKNATEEFADPLLPEDEWCFRCRFVKARRERNKLQRELNALERKMAANSSRFGFDIENGLNQG